jgi:hypothetical protein
MQGRANEIAAQLFADSGRKPTKNKVINLLAAELDMTPETVKRRTRKEWR